MDYHDLLNRLAPVLRRTARAMARPSAGVDADDLYQEGLIWLWEGHRKGAWAGRPDGWILGGARFHLMNRRRREALRRRKEAPLGADPAADPSEAIDRRLLVREMLDDGLLPDEKEALRLRYGGLTIREAGRRMGVSHVRVVQLQQSIREKWGRRYQEAEGIGRQSFGNGVE